MSAPANLINGHVTDVEQSSPCGSVDFDADELRQLRAVAAEIFAAVEGTEMAADPELPDRTYLVVKVKAAGTVEEILKQEREWHRRTGDLFSSAPERLHRLQLSIDAQE